jgi:hypothetical protein
VNAARVLERRWTNMCFEQIPCVAPPNGLAFHLRGYDRAPIEEAAEPLNTI